MIILDYKPIGFVLMIFFFKEHENMHMHMITGHLNVLKLSMNIAVVLFRPWIQFLPAINF